MNSSLEFVAVLSCVIYALTFLFTSSKAFEGVRQRVSEILDSVFPDRDYRMEECRMCMGFWLTLFLFLACLPLDAIEASQGGLFFAAYGLSYFMATQERP